MREGLLLALCAVACAVILLGVASVVSPGWWRRQRPAQTDPFARLRSDMESMAATIGTPLLPPLERLASTLERLIAELRIGRETTGYACPLDCPARPAPHTHGPNG